MCSPQRRRQSRVPARRWGSPLQVCCVPLAGAPSCASIDCVIHTAATTGLQRPAFSCLTIGLTCSNADVSNTVSLNSSHLGCCVCRGVGISQESWHQPGEGQLVGVQHRKAIQTCPLLPFWTAGCCTRKQVHAKKCAMYLSISHAIHGWQVFTAGITNLS